jgi:hypothetical protein
MNYLIILSLLITACSSVKVEFEKSGKTKYPEYKSEVKVLEKAPSEKYIKIGQLHAEGYLIDTEEDIIDKLKDKAAEHGANAIIMEPDSLKTEIKVGMENFAYSYRAPKTAEAVAIKID